MKDNIPVGYELAFDGGYLWWRTPAGEWSREGTDYNQAVAECWAHFVGPRIFRPCQVSLAINWDEDEQDRCRCDRCGGDGFIEYNDGDGGDWGEDCPSEENHLIVCRACGGTGNQ